MTPAQSAQRTVAALLASARATLGGEDARTDSEALLAHVLGRNRAWLFAHDDAVVDPGDEERFRASLQRVRSGEPLAWLTGRREFWSLDLEVDPSTLVPRPETELLVECGLELRGEGECSVLDLGTGTGAVALAVASERPRWSVTGVDIEPAAVELARRNAARTGIANARFLVGDFYAPVAGTRFALILANPPYVRLDDPCLDNPGVRREPRRALVAGRDGLDALRAIIRSAPAYLEPEGLIACEHGADQGESVRALLEQAGFVQVFTRQDLAGLDRVSGGMLGKKPRQ